MSKEIPFDPYSYPPDVRKQRKEVFTLMNRVRMLTEYDINYDYIDQVSDLVGEGAYFIAYGPHAQHLEFVHFVNIGKMLKHRPETYYLSIATSLDKDEQAAGLGSYTAKMKPVVAEQGFVLTPFTRPQDLENYLTKLRKEYEDKGQTLPREELRKVQRRFIDQAREEKQHMVDTVSDDAGFLVFIEATTASGDKDESGKRNGLQKVKGDLVYAMTEEAYRIGRPVVYLPSGFIDTNNIAEPRKPHGTPRAKLEIAKDWIGFTAKPLAKVIVGEPFTSTDEGLKKAFEDGPEAFNNYLMTRLGRILPSYAWGYYSKFLSPGA